MWRALAVVLLLWPALALAQTGTPQTKSSLNTEQDTNFADNNSNAITPLILRQTVADMIASWQQAPRVNAQVGTTYTVVVDDYGKLINFSNAAPVAVTVPQGTGNFATFNFLACNKGAGAVTLTPTTSLINGVTSYTLATNQCTMVVSDGANYQVVTIPAMFPSPALPTVQNLTTGTNATYTAPANVQWIDITIVGGGGGGGGAGGAATAGSVGGATCWNTSGTACTSPVYQAGGGAGGGAAGGAPGAGGTVSGSGACSWSAAGGAGITGTASGVNGQAGGAGGTSSRGGSSPAVAGVGAPAAGPANTGAGGPGGGLNTTSSSGAGGGAGSTCYVLLKGPAATYTYTIGAGGTHGTGGSSQGNGGDGGTGVITVTEHYGQ